MRSFLLAASLLVFINFSNISATTITEDSVLASETTSETGSENNRRDEIITRIENNEKQLKHIENKLDDLSEKYCLIEKRLEETFFTIFILLGELKLWNSNEVYYKAKKDIAN